LFLLGLGLVWIRSN